MLGGFARPMIIRLAFTLWLLIGGGSGLPRDRQPVRARSPAASIRLPGSASAASVSG